MSNIGYCSFKDVKLSSSSFKAVSEIREVMKEGNMLAYSVGAVPLFDLFLVRKPAHSRHINIAAYDWVEFAKVLTSVNAAVKYRIHQIAEPLTWQTNGKEGECWRCVVRASL